MNNFPILWYRSAEDFFEKCSYVTRTPKGNWSEQSLWQIKNNKTVFHKNSFYKIHLYPKLLHIQTFLVVNTESYVIYICLYGILFVRNKVDTKPICPPSCQVSFEQILPVLSEVANLVNLCICSTKKHLSFKNMHVFVIADVTYITKSSGHQNIETYMWHILCMKIYASS